MKDLVPLGDQGALLYFEDESAALQFTAALRAAPEPWQVDLVQAYTSVAVFYDMARCTFTSAADQLRRRATLMTDESTGVVGRRHQIPCCYERQLDLNRVAQHTGLTPDEVIRLHTATEYTVYAIGFCPGFPYLGYLPRQLTGVPRLASPRVRVEPGSVGLTGRQTGIYTEPRPGGWNLIGRTPLVLVDVASAYFPLQTGDRIQFVRIDDVEYCQLEGERLASPPGVE